METKKYRIRKGSIAWYVMENKTPLSLILLCTCVVLGFVLLSSLNANASTYEPTQREISVLTEMETYDVPLDADLQEHIVQTAKSYGLEPELVFAVIKRESNYNIDAIGDSGEAFGLMQVQEKWHKARMEKLDCTDLLDPYQNVIVGTDYLAECVREFKTTEDALTVYNAGATGAYKLYFSKGIASPYALDVMEIYHSF